VFPIRVPPLRERVSDIPQLAMFFLARFARKFGRPVDTIATATMARLVAYSWPGNIRELQNVIERAVVLSRGATLELDSELLLDPGRPGAGHGAASVTPPRAPGAPRPRTLASALEETERELIVAALEQARWVIEGAQGASKILQLHPNTLRSRMAKLGIKRAAPPSS
jgi:transcriptional regulator with GAF, ATPase, and Fis domain